MKPLYISLALPLLLLASISCSKKENNNSNIPDTQDCYNPETGLVTIIPYEFPFGIRNPLKGWREGCLARRTGFPYPYGTVCKEYMPWNMLENVASDKVDKIRAYSDLRWEGYAEMNLKAIPRAYIVWRETYNGGEVSIEDTDPTSFYGYHWPSDMTPEIRSSDNNKPSTGGYFDPEFPDRVKKLVKKLGEAWDNDPRVAFVEMGIIGEWGEHHTPQLSTFWTPHTQSFHVENRTWIPGMQEILGDAYKEAFKNKKVLVRFAYEFADYNVGVHHDSFASPASHAEDRCYRTMVERGDYWKTQPVGGELTWDANFFPGCNSLASVLANDTYRQKIINHIRILHPTYLGGVTWADFTDTEFAARAEKLQMMIGYRFLLKNFIYPAKVEKNTPFNISFTVQNTGSSPFYYEWPVEISIMDSHSKTVFWKTTLNNVNITEWLPGDKWNEQSQKYDESAKEYTINESITLPSFIPDGKYVIAIAILDPAGNVPSVRFPIYNYWKGGRHPMGYIGIGEDITEFKIAANNFDDMRQDKSLYYVR